MIAILAAAGGWIIGQQVKNPAEIQAETAPPPKSLITVPVEARELSDDIVTRVSVLFDNTDGVKITTDAAALLTPVVTGRVPERGAQLVNGSVLMEVSERPYFVLNGDLPASRTIRFGTKGPDVEQLEQALVDLGFFSGEPDADFDESTGQAISALYASEGYTPPELTEAEKDDLDKAEETVKEATDALEAAREALTEASKTETESQRLQRILSWETRAKQWEQQQRDAANWQDQDPAIVSARATEKAADKAYTKALDRLRQAEALRHPDTGEIPTVDEVIEFQKAVNEAARELNEARAETAQAIAESTAEAEAREELEVNRREFEIAQVQYQETLADLTPDTKQQADALALRGETLTKAQATLDELTAKTGPHLPDTEFMFLTNLPRNISKVLVERGDFISASLEAVEIAGDTLLVEGAIGENQRGELSQGQRVIIDDPGLDLQIEGTFSRLDDVTDGSKDYPNRYYFRVELEGEYDAEQLVSVGNFRMVIPIGRTQGEVLAVPRNALRTDFSGNVQVQVERRPGVTEFVDVTLGLQPELGGYVEVIPVKAGTLSFGDQVVIQEGTDGAASTPAAESPTTTEADGG